MNAPSLRRQLSDAHLEALARACRDGADRSAAFFSIIADLGLTAGETEIDDAARRAARLLDALLRHEERQDERRRHLTDERTALFGRDRFERARACENCDGFDPWLGPATIGSLAVSEIAQPAAMSPHPRILDGGLAAEAVVIALREAASPDVIRSQREFLETETLIGFGETGALDRLDAALRRLQAEFIANGRYCGQESDEAAAAALAAVCRLRGRALSRRPEVAGLAGTAYALGLSAMRSFPDFVERRRVAENAAEAGRLSRMIGVARQVNDARAGLIARPGDEPSARLLGAAALGAILGYAFGWRDAPMESAATLRQGMVALGHDDGATLLIDGMIPVHVPEGRLRSLAPLSLAAALRRLEALSTDPRQSRDVRESSGRVADALAHSARGWRTDRVSFGSHVGMPQSTPARSELRDGLDVHWAVPAGKFPSVRAAEGRRGRRLRCRTLADAEGRLVGYAGFDVLSGEFSAEGGGEGVHAVYGLDGRRFGYLRADDAGGRVRRGEPPWGFMTAPAVISWQ